MAIESILVHALTSANLVIREAFEINLKDSIVILDEGTLCHEPACYIYTISNCRSIAHNIEDTAREASSFEVHEKELLGIQKELTFLIKYFILVEAHRKLLFVSFNLFLMKIVNLKANQQPYQIVESLMGWIVDPQNVFLPLQYEHYTNS
jgi:hypothetical protein